MTRKNSCGVNKLRNGKWAVGWYEYDETFTHCSFKYRAFDTYEAAVAGAKTMGFKVIKSRSFERGKQVIKV